MIDTRRAALSGYVALGRRFRKGWIPILSFAVTLASIGYVFFTAAMNPDFQADRLYNPVSIEMTLMALFISGVSACLFHRAPRIAFAVSVGAMVVLAFVFHDRAAAVTPLYWYAILLLSINISGPPFWTALAFGGMIDTIVSVWLKLPHSESLDIIANTTLGSASHFLVQSAVNVTISYGIVACIGRLVSQHQRRSRDHSVQIARLQRERDREIERAVTDERRRMARELHDVSAHHLTAVLVQGKAARTVLSSHPEEVAGLLDGVIDQGDHAMKSMRQLVDVLRIEQSSTTWPQPSVHDLNELIQRCREAGLRVHARLAGDLDDLDSAVELSCYRIVQECLSNVMRHAPGVEAYVTVKEVRGVLNIEVMNRVMNPPTGVPDRHGLGLVGMRERAESFGGSIEVQTTEDGWWRVAAQLPTEGVIAR